MVWQKYYILKCALFSNVINRYLSNRMNYNFGNMFSVTMIIFLQSLSYVALERKKLQDPKHVTITQISLPISILGDYATTGLNPSHTHTPPKKKKNPHTHTKKNPHTNQQQQQKKKERKKRKKEREKERKKKKRKKEK